MKDYPPKDLDRKSIEANIQLLTIFADGVRGELRKKGADVNEDKLALKDMGIGPVDLDVISTDYISRLPKGSLLSSPKFNLGALAAMTPASFFAKIEDYKKQISSGNVGFK